MFYSCNCVCIFAPVYGLLEYSRTFDFEPTMGRWQSILWGFPPFCVFETRIQTCHFLCCSNELHFLRLIRVFWANKKSGNAGSPGRKVTRVLRNPPTPSYPVGGHHCNCVLRSLVVTKFKTWLLEPVSPRMHASPIFFQLSRFLTDSDQSIPSIGWDHP